MHSFVLNFNDFTCSYSSLVFIFSSLFLHWRLDIYQIQFFLNIASYSNRIYAEDVFYSGGYDTFTKYP